MRRRKQWPCKNDIITFSQTSASLFLYSSLLNRQRTRTVKENSNLLCIKYQDEALSRKRLLWKTVLDCKLCGYCYPCLTMYRNQRQKFKLLLKDVGNADFQPGIRSLSDVLILKCQRWSTSIYLSIFTLNSPVWFIRVENYSKEADSVIFRTISNTCCSSQHS